MNNITDLCSLCVDLHTTLATFNTWAIGPTWCQGVETGYYKSQIFSVDSSTEIFHNKSDLHDSRHICSRHTIHKYFVIKKKIFRHDYIHVNWIYIVILLHRLF